MTSSPQPTPTDKGTRYVVLGRTTGDESWVEVNSGVKAASANAAVRAVVGNTDGEYVAIPTRSWKPVKVTVETTKTIRLG